MNWLFAVFFVLFFVFPNLFLKKSCLFTRQINSKQKKNHKDTRASEKMRRIYFQGAWFSQSETPPSLLPVLVHPDPQSSRSGLWKWSCWLLSRRKRQFSTFSQVISVPKQLFVSPSYRGEMAEMCSCKYRRCCCCCYGNHGKIRNISVTSLH